MMKSMYGVSVLCCAAAFVLLLPAGPVSAQTKAFGVALTPAQQEQFKAFNVAAEPAKKAVRDNAALSQAERQAQMKAIYDGIKEQLKAILTAEQLKQMEAAPKK